MRVPQVIEIPVIRDATGALGVVEDAGVLPFTPHRIYFLFDLHSGERRGQHAHKELEQFIFAINGACTIELNDGTSEFTFVLDRPNKGLYVPPGFWRSLGEFSGGTAVVVIASKNYEESDYIRSWEDFTEWVQE